MKTKLTNEELFEQDYYRSRYEDPTVITPIVVIMNHDLLVIGDEIFKSQDLTEDDVIAMAKQEESNPEWLVHSLQEIINHRRKIGDLK